MNFKLGIHTRIQLWSSMKSFCKWFLFWEANEENFLKMDQIFFGFLDNFLSLVHCNGFQDTQTCISPQLQLGVFNKILGLLGNSDFQSNFSMSKISRIALGVFHLILSFRRVQKGDLSSWIIQQRLALQQSRLQAAVKLSSI